MYQVNLYMISLDASGGQIGSLKGPEPTCAPDIFEKVGRERPRVERPFHVSAKAD